MRTKADILSAVESCSYFAELYGRSEAAKFGLTLAEFGEILLEVSGRYLPESTPPREVADFHRGLRLRDLALARGCAKGNEPAWNLFLAEYRQKLYAIASAIAKDDTTGRELADSLYAELWNSKLVSYTGRGSLEGWLRMVLAQEFVNRCRAQSRLVSFDEQIQPSEPVKEPVDPRIAPAVDAALAELPPEERLLLASWYLDGRTLAEIARMLGVHESTVSRRMEKITTTLRKRIVAGLQKRGLDARAAEDALKADVRELDLDIAGRLAQEKSGGTFSRKGLKSWMGSH